MGAMGSFFYRSGKEIRFHKVRTGTGDEKTAVSDKAAAAEIDF